MKKQSIFKSFRCAFNGIFGVLKSERNFRIQLVLFTAVTASALFLGATRTEFISLLVCSASVLGMELINSAIEELCNFVSPEYHSQIGKIKDIAAGAVLVVSLFALVVGVLIFSSLLAPLF